MKNILVIIQIILSILLSTLIFLQSNGDTESRSNILSTTTVEKRGWEKIMFDFTIFIIVIFLISSIIQTLI
ncbi:MAG: preprotein translocase subunit SecG [Candidatus Shapirobacteria bacterium]|jgi:protein translocase SecG subunit|nr:preprotein translocase subunit SecG [Candidatus Shapirobacteria bacterium]